MSLSVEASEAAAFLQAYRFDADARLQSLLLTREATVSSLPFEPAAYHSHLREYVLRGGKRVRGALVMLGYEAVSGRPGSQVLDASLAFELAHAYLLIFDDFMDRDDVRRGGLSLHLLAAQEAARRGSSDAAHRGVSISLLLGLLAQSMSFDLLLSHAPAGADLALVARYFNEILEGVTVGQLLDVAAADAPAPVAASDVAEIHRRKTGLYTTEGPVVLGALLAGASLDDARVQALKAWAGPVGEAFQLVDDLLGCVGDSGETGKSASGDLREGKRTSVLEEALVRLQGDEKARLSSLAGRALTESEAVEAKLLIERSGAVEAIGHKADGLEKTARRALEEVGLAPQAQRMLAALGRLVVERRS